MRAYRYLEPKWGEQAWFWGRWGISTTKSVQALEDQQRDELDSAIVMRLAHKFKGRTDDDPEIVRAARRLGFVITDCYGGEIDYQRTTVRPGNMMCFCNQANSSAFPNKPWVFEITDLHAFARELMTDSGGRLPLNFDVKAVTYGEITRDLALDPDVRADPFFKSEKYASEEEVRIFWPAAREPKYVALTSLAALKYVRLIRSPIKGIGALEDDLGLGAVRGQN